MFLIRNFSVLLLIRPVFSEWIKIPQTADSLNEKVLSNEKPFDYSTYKDFFSIIEPNIELVDQMEPNNSSMHSSNVSTLKSVFSDSETHSDKINGRFLKKDQSQSVKVEQKPNETANKIVFKRLELKRLDFNGILKFFRNMQKSFGTDSISNVGDKVKFLLQFKDDLLTNIG